MNTACIRFGTDDFHLIAELHQPTGDVQRDAAAHAHSIITEALAASSWPQFLQILRHRGPELRAALVQLVGVTSGSDGGQAAADARATLADRLRVAGMPDARADLVEHAQRMADRAHALHHMLQHRELVTGEHVASGDQAMWMFTFARLILALAAEAPERAAAESTRFAVQLAVDEARLAYAHWATALEQSQDEDAA